LANRPRSWSDHSACHGRVRNHPGASDQDRRARDRAPRAHPRKAAVKLPGAGAVPRRRPRPHAVRPV